MLPNFRKNPITGHWIIVAEGRDLRPNEFQAEEVRRVAGRCPFCAGHEDDTPGEVASFRADAGPANESDWVVRVVPNKYPALIADETLSSNGNGEAFGPYEGFQSGGVHELVVESRRHVVSFGELTQNESRIALRVYRERLKRLAEHRRLAYGMVFKNCRPGAGASIEHVHSQIIGTSIVPASVSQHIARTVKYHRTHGRPLSIDLIDFECSAGDRIVEMTDRFIAFCPFASHMCYETWIFPRQVHPSFLKASDSDLDELADLLHRTVRRIEGVLNDPPYNLTLHVAPFDSSVDEDYQWHLELSPRLTKLAGFEWGTGCMILPVSPESAARQLREFEGV